MPHFSILSWNVENLFTFQPNPGRNETRPSTQAIYDLKLNHIRDTILNALNGETPDVIALQEIGEPEAFDDLRQRLGDPYIHSALGLTGSPSHPIRVGLISRFPLDNVEQWMDFPETLKVTDFGGNEIKSMGRSALKATVTPEAGFNVHVVTAHLKSKLLTFPPGPNGQQRFDTNDERERALFTGAASIKRAAEATFVRFHILDLIGNNKDPLVLVGDMNDEVRSVVGETLFGTYESVLGGAFQAADRHEDTRLYNLVEYLPAYRRFSRVFEDRGELIDHIYVNRELAHMRWQVGNIVDHTGSIVNNPGRRKDAVWPDHAPVFATFRR